MLSVIQGTYSTNVSYGGTFSTHPTYFFDHAINIAIGLVVFGLPLLVLRGIGRLIFRLPKRIGALAPATRSFRTSDGLVIFERDSKGVVTATTQQDPPEHVDRAITAAKQNLTQKQHAEKSEVWFPSQDS